MIGALRAGAVRRNDGHHARGDRNDHIVHPMGVVTRSPRRARVAIPVTRTSGVSMLNVGLGSEHRLILQSGHGTNTMKMNTANTTK